jgi:hypothetical protein
MSTDTRTGPDRRMQLRRKSDDVETVAWEALDALYAALNLGSSARHGARLEAEADPTRPALDVDHHMDKIRAAIRAIEGDS